MIPSGPDYPSKVSVVLSAFSPFDIAITEYWREIYLTNH